MRKPVILTGIRSNSEPTLGNYLGAMLPLVRLQKKHSDSYQINMFVPDLHSFTTPVDYSQLYANTVRNLKMYLAAGLDLEAESTYIYRQSFIPAHSELTWILDCFIYVGELNRMTQYKEKSGGKESVSAGLYNYPALMAADMLLYDAKFVPVGEDQRQHLELTRDVALRINNQFGKELFVPPEPWKKQLEFSGETSGIRIRSLKFPENKMSKSVKDPNGTILMCDDPSKAKTKILNATTDSFGSIAFNFKTQPGVSNLLQIIALLSDQPQDYINSQWVGKTSYSELKQEAANIVEELLMTFQKKLASVDEKKLMLKLTQDESAMRELSNSKLLRIQQEIGLRER